MKRTARLLAAGSALLFVLTGCSGDRAGPGPSSAPQSSATQSSAPQASATQPSAPQPSSAPGRALPPAYLPGINDPGCRSQLRPVVLAHGTFATTSLSFPVLAPLLRVSGRCVYALDYGNGGIGPVRDSARRLAELVDTVRARTGSDQVDMVGYSQGGLLIRAALRWYGLAPVVRTVVLIAPSFHGTTATLAAQIPAQLCPACVDQTAGSPLLTELDAGGDLDGDVRYAVISTLKDVVVVPVSSQVPAGPADRVRSLVVERECPTLLTDHVGLPAVPGVAKWVLAALDTQGRPPDSALTCR